MNDENLDITKKKGSKATNSCKRGISCKYHGYYGYTTGIIGPKPRLLVKVVFHVKLANIFVYLYIVTYSH